MSFWHPSPETQKLAKFWVDCAQALTVVVAIVAAVFTYWSYNDTRKRELQKPYEEKKLALYLEAARVAAHLTASPDSPVKVQTEERFFELYWGELAFVETKEIANGMHRVCMNLFVTERCEQPLDSKIGTAITLARQASTEIRQAWDKEKQPDRR